jgi:hypoxanthine-DNA glycosylase
VANRDARVLVLGTLPGPESLRRQQYYGQPRNAFWKIMGELYGAGPEVPYRRRLQVLKQSRVALWDVCHRAYREGALDADIDPASVVPNDIKGFLELHPGIRLICCNGQTAGRLYERRIWPGLSPGQQAIRREILPSTSPAHAAMRFDEKLRRWEIVRKEAGR